MCKGAEVIMSKEKKASVTVLLPAGRLPVEVMGKAHSLAEKNGLKVYLSNGKVRRSWIQKRLAFLNGFLLTF